MLEQVLSCLGWWKYPIIGEYIKSIETGRFEIKDGIIATNQIITNQYFRIVGSVLNDGVYMNTDGLYLNDETFDGEVWGLSIPRALIVLCDEIQEWEQENGKPSQYKSESFGGYSYTRNTDSDGDVVTWKNVYKNKLAPWKKV